MDPLRRQINELETKISNLGLKKNELEHKLRKIEESHENRLGALTKDYPIIKNIVHFYDINGKTVFWEINLRIEDISYHVNNFPKMEDPSEQPFFDWYNIKACKHMSGSYQHRLLKKY